MLSTSITTSLLVSLRMSLPVDLLHPSLGPVIGSAGDDKLDPRHLVPFPLLDRLSIVQRDIVDLQIRVCPQLVYCRIQDTHFQEAVFIIRLFFK